MMTTAGRYHLLSMAELPKLLGKYCYSLRETEFAWTQQEGWLLLFLTHSGLLTIGARTTSFAPGSLFVVPPASRCRLSGIPDVEDPTGFWFRFEPSFEASPIVALPHFANLGKAAEFWEQRFRLALDRGFSMGPEMQVAFGDLLWSLALDPASIRHRPALEAAERFVEDHIGSPLRVEDLAEAVEVSHNQLIRLFKQEHGMTPVEYIRLRRQHHACRLLLESSLPIKAVAAAVGIKDLAQFNHLVHGASGLSPREFRASRRPPALFRS